MASQSGNSLDVKHLTLSQTQRQTSAKIIIFHVTDQKLINECPHLQNSPQMLDLGGELFHNHALSLPEERREKSANQWLISRCKLSIMSIHSPVLKWRPLGRKPV